MTGAGPAAGAGPALHSMGATMATMRRPNLTQAESDFLNHITMWGSAGYPIDKVKGGWVWREAFGVKGAPTVYKTKKAAAKAIEAYCGILCDKVAGRLPAST